MADSIFSGYRINALSGGADNQFGGNISAVGDISASGTISASNFNIPNWNTVYSTVKTNSATWGAGGTGNVSGGTSSTNLALAVYSGTGGKTLSADLRTANVVKLSADGSLDLNGSKLWINASDTSVPFKPSLSWTSNGRVEYGWNSTYGANFELYHQDEGTFPGQMRFVFGGQKSADIGSIQFLQRVVSTWNTVASIDSGGISTTLSVTGANIKGTTISGTTYVNLPSATWQGTYTSVNSNSAVWQSNTARAITIWPPGTETTTGFLNNQAVYSLIFSKEACTVNGVIVYVTTVGSDPTNMKAALYTSAGTSRLAVRTTNALVNVLGGFKIAFDTPYTVAADTPYWVGVWGDPSNTVFLFTNNAINNTANNNAVTATDTSATVPFGNPTASKIVGTLY